MELGDLPTLLEEKRDVHYLPHIGCCLVLTSTGTGSLTCLSPNGASLTAAQKARIRGTPAWKWRAEITEQYELQIEKLHANAAGLELVSMPTFVSRPSTLSLTN